MRNIPLCIGYHVGPLSRLSKSCIHFYLILLDFLYFDVVLIMGNPSPLGSQLQIGHNTLLLSVILHYCLNSAKQSCVYIYRMLLCALLHGTTKLMLMHALDHPVTVCKSLGCSEFRLWHHTQRLQIVLAVLTGKLNFNIFPLKSTSQSCVLLYLCGVASVYR